MRKSKLITEKTWNTNIFKTETRSLCFGAICSLKTTDKSLHAPRCGASLKCRSQAK
jgi:hypothetical protein